MSDLGDSDKKKPDATVSQESLTKSRRIHPSKTDTGDIISLRIPKGLWFGGDAVERISKAKPSDVQEIAGSQIQLLLGYYQLVLDQAKKSFRWALIAAGVGLAFFIVAVGSILYWNAGNAATISVVSGAIVEVISAINFYLYSKTSGHLADFHNRLEGTQRYLLANSICESLEGANKQAARIELVRAIAQINLADAPPKAFATAEKG